MKLKKASLLFLVMIVFVNCFIYGQTPQDQENQENLLLRKLLEEYKTKIDKLHLMKGKFLS